MLEAIGIVSANPEPSVRFYRMLGVELVRAGTSEHYEARTASGIRILLDSVELIRTFEPDYQRPPGAGVVMCFRQESPAKVDALYAELERAGFAGKKPPWDAFWNQRYACALDPDGNQIDLFADL